MFFCDHFQKVLIRSNEDQPMITTIFPWPHVLMLPHFSFYEVFDVLKQPKNKHTAGLNKISSFIFSNCAFDFVELLLHVSLA